MKQYSDQEEGFISSEVEVKKQLIRLNNIKQPPPNITRKNFQVNYRFAVGFLKKEPSLAYNTPLTLRNEGKTSEPIVKRKQKSTQIYEHPFKEYGIGQKYSLKYCRQPNQPLSYQTNFIKNQIPLFDIDDKNSTLWKEIKPFQIQQSAIHKDDLYFDSRFQSGNLHCAFRKNHEHEYHLFMSNDTNTLGYNQWFYFSLQNARKGVKYTFKIVNYRKILNFYRNGQQIAVFSMKEALRAQSGWYRAGNNITFEESNVRTAPQAKLYTLSFDLEFHHEKDYIMLASTIPYSYSKMIQDIHEIKQESEKSDRVSVTISPLCKSICNNEVPELTITNKNSEKKENQKRMIIIMARQHPGEVWSSYLMLGVMRSFLKANPQTQYLLDNFIIKIYPMVNVDGVIYGNFRCDVTGVDLNRRWRDPSKIFHPQIFEIKKKIQSYHKKWRIQLCFDLHGHSKNYNFFCYACKQNNYTCRILPYLIQSQNPMFYMPSCTFGLTRNKQTTARAAISKIIRSENVLTIQTSGFGYRPNVQAKSFSPLDIFQMAESLLIATRYFLDKNSTRYQQSENNIRQNYNEYLSYDKQNQQESGSDSQPEKDQIDFKTKLNTIFDKKFEKEYKSFVREDEPFEIHNTKIVFDGFQQSTKKIDCSSDTLLYPQNANLSLLIGQNQIDNDLSPKKSIDKLRNQRALQKDKEKYKSHDINNKQKDSKNSVMYRISLGANADFKQASTQRKNQHWYRPKNILIRDNKKRLSLVDNTQKKSFQTLSFNHTNQGDQIHKSKHLKKQQNGKAIEQFVTRFQRFMPNIMAHKARNKLDILEKELQQDDPQQQLNIMLQNKRRLELEKIKVRLSIEDSTQIAERQGKIRFNRKQPIITYNRFKQTDKIKNEIRKLGQFSQRNFDRHN